MRNSLRTVAIVICLSIFLGGITSYAAASPIITPRFQYINSIRISFDILSTGKVLITSSVDARSCTAVSQRVQLQELVRGSWEKIDEWTVTDQGTNCWFENSEWSVSGGSYRAVTYVSVYVGSVVVETAEVVSQVR